MGTKVGDWSITYKKGNIVFRNHLYQKVPLDMSDLPDNPADRHDEVVRRLRAIPDPYDPSQKYFGDASLAWIARLADAVIREAE